jgi:hypothetical protein
LENVEGSVKKEEDETEDMIGFDYSQTERQLISLV